MHAAFSKVENSAQGLSCQLKFVHAPCKDRGTWAYFIGIAFIGKLFCPSKRKKKRAKASIACGVTVRFVNSS